MSDDLQSANRCILCEWDGAVWGPSQSADAARVKCRRCGEFLVTNTAMQIMSNNSDVRSALWKVSSATRRASDAGRSLTLTSDNLAMVADGARVPTTLPELLDRVLVDILERQRGLTASVAVSYECDFPRVGVENSAELRNAVRILIGQEYLQNGPGNAEYTVTPAGWRHADEIRQKQPVSTQAFVAMWFSDVVQEAWDVGIKPALEQDCGYTAVRMDLIQHNDDVTDRMLAEIRRSVLVVADFTGNRAGVYYEAGFARGLGRPVIWTCQEDHMEGVHFDTNHLNHIVWTTPQHLRQALRDRVLATMPLTPSLAQQLV